jgi:hypothetical protein
MPLPLIEVFKTPYEAWTTRRLSKEEALEATRQAGHPIFEVNDKLLARVTSPFEAARHVARVGVDNSIDHFVNDVLDSDPVRTAWQALMPSKTPRELTRYQREYSKSNLAAVDGVINTVGVPLSSGQTLFHGGLWPANTPQWVCARPLSTTFCPQVALLNATHRAKAYKANRLDLFVLQIQSPRTKAFAYKRVGTQFGHENEVVLAAGATLRLHSEKRIRSDYTVSQWRAPDKQIPVYVLLVDCD